MVPSAKKKALPENGFASQNRSSIPERTPILKPFKTAIERFWHWKLTQELVGENAFPPRWLQLYSSARSSGGTAQKASRNCFFKNGKRNEFIMNHQWLSHCKGLHLWSVCKQCCGPNPDFLCSNGVGIVALKKWLGSRRIGDKMWKNVWFFLCRYMSILLQRPPCLPELQQSPSLRKQYDWLYNQPYQLNYNISTNLN